MKTAAIKLLACPVCRSKLVLDAAPGDPVIRGALCCPRCQQTYPIERGIPHFIQQAELTGSNRRFARLYDWLSWFYRAFSVLAFAYIGMNEERARREITDRLQPHGGSVIEVSIGPGVNLPYLVGRPDVGHVFGLDISLGQLRRCQSYLQRKRWSVDLFLGSAERLPFADDSFDGVFHVGGINFFNDKQAAIAEMIRVARPGARILIADESEKGARAYEKIIPGFKRGFEGQREAITAPLDLIPDTMQEVRVFDVWKGWLYCLEFRKP